MTRKDYIKFANALRDDLSFYRNNGQELEAQALETFAYRMCQIFSADNDRFDHDKFLEASTAVQPMSQF